MDKSFLSTGERSSCFGCEACAQVCPHSAIRMKEDEEGFRYPAVDREKCVSCGLCLKVCPYENQPKKHDGQKYVFGGYIADLDIRMQSTSGGAFSAIADAWCDDNYVIFGAASDGLKVFHTYVTDKSQISIFRKSKYSQSVIGDSYKQARQFLKDGKKVLFSGTPCQIAGLRSYLLKTDTANLLTVEVICEGVPSPLYIRKLNDWIKRKFGSPIAWLDYRYKDHCRWDFQVMNILTKKDLSKHGNWDFETMAIKLLRDIKELGKRGVSMKKDRWFNPFWSVWMNHLMSRPSCYKCPFTTTGRQADITLGDLWGVHIYCPELYGNNTGCSLVICNTEKGREAVKAAEKYMKGHELDFNEALKYQSPLRRTIPFNDDRKQFMEDLQNPDMDYCAINKKWAKKPTLKLLFQKYIWGNRQKVFLWNLFHKSDCRK